MKKTAYFFLAVIFILVFITGCGEKPAYYRSINLDGKYSIVGQYPVSAKRAQKINSYHFIYDDKGRVSKIQYQHLGRPAGHDPLFGISAVAIEYGKDYEKRSFCDAAGRIVPNKDGIYSLRLKLNEKKEPEAVFFYNKDGQLSEDKSGVAQISWALDDWSRRIIKAVRFNAKGQSISAFEGGYETYYVYDDQGNLIEQSNRGKNGELVEDRDGVAVIKLGYDGQNLIEAAYYGNNEQLAFPRGRSFALIRWQYDGNNKIEESYYGADRQLKTLPPLDYALIRWQYNADGNLEEESYYGTDYQLKSLPQLGYAVVRWSYDDKGNLAEESYYGMDQQPIAFKGGKVFRERFIYDEKGNLRESVALDKEGRAVK